MDKLLENNARDVFYTPPIYMKKNRPAIKLEVICDGESMESLKEIILEKHLRLV